MLLQQTCKSLLKELFWLWDCSYAWYLHFLYELGPWFDFLDRKHVYFKRANNHIWEGTVIKNCMFFCLKLQNEHLANPKADITELSLNPVKILADSLYSNGRKQK